MLNFCIKSIPNIGFKYIPKEEMESLRREHEAKYANVTDHVLGTRSYHQFVSFDQNRSGAKDVVVMMHLNVFTILVFYMSKISNKGMLLCKIKIALNSIKDRISC